MNIFKAALRVLTRHPLVILNALFLGVMGSFVMVGFGEAASTAIEDHRPTVAVIDRDQSQLSGALRDFLMERGTPVAVGTSTRAIQDATAKSEAAYILIIPAGFESDFDQGIREREEIPLLETVISVATADGHHMDQLATTYLRLVRAGRLADPEADLAAAVERANRLAAVKVERAIVPSENPERETARFRYYMRWMGYSLTVGAIALPGFAFSAFGTGELRRRNFVAPISAARLTGQIGLASAVVCLVLLAWCLLWSFTPAAGGWPTLTEAPGTFALVAATALVFATVPLSIGLLGAQVGMGMAGLTGLANIVGLVFAFLGGVFIDDSVLPSVVVQRIAEFIPSTWYGRAIDAAADGTFGPLASAIGVQLLFAAAIAAVALLVNRLRFQTADAGGNYAAESL
jgi:ABC-2 type transport system permease protein